MFYAKVFYTGDGSTTTFAVPFPYLAQAHIKVYIDNVLTTAYTWATDSSIQFDSAPGNGVEIGFIRETPRDERLVDFQDASNLTEEILDLDSQQVFYLAQEYLDQYTSSIVLDDSGNWDVQSNRLTDVSQPVDLDDAATKRWVLNNLPSADQIVSSSSNPTTGDDANDGYAVGTRWLNTSTLRMFTLVDDTVASAVWTPVAGVHVKTADPTISDDASQGFVEGDQWVRTDTQRVWALMDGTNGAAVWTELAKESDLTSVESDVSSLQSDMATAQSDINQLQTDVGNNTSDINSLDGRMTTAEGNISSNDSDISSLQGDVANLQGDVTNLQSDTLAKAGGTMSGPLVLHGNPSADLHAAPRQYVDVAFANPNLLFNGAMQVWQRGTSFTGQEYTADRWHCNQDGSSGVSWVLSAATPDDSVQYSIKAEVTTAYSGSDALARIQQRLETIDILNSGWKYNDSSSYLTLSFWVISSLAGTYHGFVTTNRDGTTRRSLSFEFTLAADTWKKVEVQIPGDPGLTLDAGNVDSGLDVTVVLHYDTDFTTSGHTTGQWQDISNPDLTPDFPQNWLGTVGNTFYFTKAKLEVGEVATPFQALSYGEEFARCQRYYCEHLSNIYGGAYGTGNSMVWWHFPVTMRASPSVSYNHGGGTVSSEYFRTQSFGIYVTGDTSTYMGGLKADAEL